MSNQTTRRQIRERVKNEWSEASTDDGYWMSLKVGWTFGDATVIHENNRNRCLARLSECVFDPNHPAWGTSFKSADGEQHIAQPGKFYSALDGEVVK